MQTTPRNDWITTSVAARFILGVSIRQVNRMCLEGVFKSAVKPGTRNWKLKRSEVESHLNRKIDNG